MINVFHRLNAFGLRLNPQELRHGKYLGEKYKGIFRSVVIDAAQRWQVLWERHKVVSVRGRLRMADDQLVAEMFGVLLDGVSDGGQPNINRLYDRYDGGMPEGTSERLDRIIEFVFSHFMEVLTPRLKGSPHFLMLFAATAHALIGIPNGDMGRGGNPNLPTRSNNALTDAEIVLQNLTRLGGILKLKADDVPRTFFEFRVASAGTTHRMKSRSQRFITFYKALLQGVTAGVAMMASAASVSQAYEEFEAETQALAVRFQSPMPTSPPFSVSCPPLHEDSRLMLVVLLQNAWARFCEDLLVSSVFGSGPTLGGKHLSEIAIPPESASTISHFRKLKGEVAHELPWQNDYPIWHNPEYVVRLSDRLKPDNDYEIQSGLGASVEVRNLNTVRNYIVHGSNESAYRNLLVRYGTANLSVPQFLMVDTGSGVSVFEEWIKDLLRAARNGAL